MKYKYKVVTKGGNTFNTTSKVKLSKKRLVFSGSPVKSIKLVKKNK